MRKMKYVLSLVLATGLVVGYLASCSDSKDPAALVLVSLMTDGGVALDEATSASQVPLDATIIATFDKAVEPTSATASTISVSVNDVVVPTTISVVGPVVTITPNSPLAAGTDHKVTVTAGLKATDGGAATPGEFTFGSFGPPVVNAPQQANLLSFFDFNGEIVDRTGTHTPNATDVDDITFVTDRFGFAGLAASFNGTTSIAEIPDGDDYLVGPSFSISFWIKADGTKDSHFVLGLAGWYGFQFEIMGGAWTADDKGVKLATRYDISGGTDAEDTWWNAEPNGWQGSTFAKDVAAPDGVDLYFKDKWAHVVCTYDAATQIGRMFVNGEKTREWDFGLWPADPAPSKFHATGVKFAGNTTGGGEKLALGFIQASGNRIIPDTWADPADPLNNHFKGLMDDLRIWKVSLTQAEIEALYNAEKP